MPRAAISTSFTAVFATEPHQNASWRHVESEVALGDVAVDREHTPLDAIGAGPKRRHGQAHQRTVGRVHGFVRRGDLAAVRVLEPDRAEGRLDVLCEPDPD